MVDLYEFFRAADPPINYKRLMCKDSLFVYFECPQVRMKDDMFVKHHCIVFVIKGKKIVHRDGKSHPLYDGVSIFIRKGAYIQERVLDSGWCAISFFLPDPYLKQILIDYQKQSTAVISRSKQLDQIISLDVSESTRSFYQSMFPYLNQAIPPDENILELKFRELLFTILGNPNNSGLLTQLIQLATENKVSLTEIMENNFMYNLSLQDYADLTCRSLASFKRDFSKVYNMTPGKWLMSKRLNYAESMLNATSKSVEEISFECGFESATHFIRMFKAKFGSPPMRYRKHKAELVA